MSISDQVILRYRDEGHLRFDLPAVLCGTAIAPALLRELGAQEGVYRVDLAAGRRKLSIRYLTTVCDFKEVISRLQATVRTLYQAHRQLASHTTAPTATDHPPALYAGRTTLSDWLKRCREDVRETVTAMKIMLARLNSGASLRPAWIKEFLNDLVMLYLIKLHWHHIITDWLPRPWTHRYEWAATLYLIYLSVQSRLPKAA